MERMRARLGEEADAFFESLSDAPHTSITLNPNKRFGHPSVGTSVPWNPNGRYLVERPSFVSDPHYHGGSYYSQEASSMLVHAILERLPLPEATLGLDLCAAPGGKSIVLLESIGEAGFLISNEVIKARSRILIENLRKWGRANWLPASAHPSSWSRFQDLFDLILVDAPCSGEGMFRKEPKALSEWSEDNVRFCAQRQASILSDIYPCLKNGGFMIYSTCTYSEDENEQRSKQLEEIGLRPFALTLPEDWGFTPVGSNAYQAYPHKVKGEGFFLSVFVKGEPNTMELEKKSKNETELIEPMSITVPEGFRVEVEGERSMMKSSRFEDQIATLLEGRILLQEGLELGRYKGKDFIPSHDLAMSGLVNGIEHVALDHGRAIKYLRRETFPLDIEKDGWYLMAYEGTILGWAKIAAGRMKNHYPKEWMIRKRW